MGKRIIQQRRGKGSSVYRSAKKNFLDKRPGYPRDFDGEYTVKKLIATTNHTTPIAKLVNEKGESFYNFAANNIYIGQKISFMGHNPGDVSRIGDLKNGTKIFNIEKKAKDGGKLVRSAGNSAVIMNKTKDSVTVYFPSKTEKKLDSGCRATVGIAAGSGLHDRPILKAGKMYHIMKSKSRLWPRTSAVAMNAIDHPFGSGRGKRIKSKISKRNASPGKKVGHLRPKRTGRKKR